MTLEEKIKATEKLTGMPFDKDRDFSIIFSEKISDNEERILAIATEDNVSVKHGYSKPNILYMKKYIKSVEEHHSFGIVRVTTTMDRSGALIGIPMNGLEPLGKIGA